MDRDKVLVLIKGLGLGGAEQLVLDSLRTSNRSSFHYEVAYVLPAKNQLVQPLTKLGIPVHCLSSGTTPWPVRLKQLLAGGNFRLVHAHSPLPAVAARLACKPLRIPVVYTEHLEWQHYHKLTYWANILTFKRNSHVVCVSDGVLASLSYPKGLKWLSMPSAEVLYHGVDLGEIASARSAPDRIRAELRIDDSEVVVGTVANFRPQKALELLVRAAPEVLQIRPVRFLFVGSGPTEKGVRQLARSLGISRQVTFLGARRDRLEIVNVFDVFVLPSLYEGLPVALIEAMAMCKAVVASDVAGIREVVKPGVNGLLVPPSNSKALASAIRRLVLDEELRANLADKAEQSAINFSIQNATRHYESIYRHLVSKP